VAVTMKAVAIDLDAVLGDTHLLWREFLVSAARRYVSIAPLDVDHLPTDRREAAVVLDEWAAHGIGDWRSALARFAEERAPVFLRPNAEANGAVRSLAAGGYRIGVVTDAPKELAEVVVAHLGLARHVEVLETRDEKIAVVTSRDELVRLAGAIPTTRTSSTRR
jgi:phosphoglycolate phosphatase-like HAD superfamily hydrolase